MNKPDDVSAEAWEMAKTKDGLDYRGDVKLVVARHVDAAIAKERERCAMVADEYDGDGLTVGYDAHLGDAYLTRREIANAIRNPSKP